MKRTPGGPVENLAEIESLLAESWRDLKGDEGGMADYKLIGRMEDVTWKPPLLNFSIERHGAIVGGGSTRAEIQDWQVNVETGAAMLVGSGRRQIYPMAKRLDVGPLADQLASLIIQGERSEYLKWNKDGTVYVRFRKLLPEGFAQTTAGRRKRLKQALSDKLKPHGWKELPKRNSYGTVE